MRRALVDMRPARLEDIIALVESIAPALCEHSDLLRRQAWRRGAGILNTMLEPILKAN